MDYSLSRMWPALALRGVLAIVFGVLAFFWPGALLLAIAYMFAAYAFVDGCLSVYAAVSGRGARGPRWLLGLAGLAGIAFGAVTFIWPQTAVITDLVLLYLVAYWLIFTGVLQVVGAIRLRRYIEGEWALALSGVLSVVLGFLMAVLPLAGLLVMALWISAYAFLNGVLLLVAAFRLRGRAREVERREGFTRRRPVAAGH